MRRKAASAGGAPSAESLPRLIRELSRHYSAPAPLSDPLALVLWENIGYLIDESRRLALLEEMRVRVGFDAKRIALAPKSLLLDIANRGGMRPEVRVERWRRIAEIVLDECGGDLDGALPALPPVKARALLKRFPSIGDPGADRILLFSGMAARPALDSNGLRVLLRLGLVAQGKSYAAAYRAAIDLVEQTCPHESDWLISAYMLLRDHGRTLCKRTAPLCMACPLDGMCAHAPAAGL